MIEINITGDGKTYFYADGKAVQDREELMKICLALFDHIGISHELYKYIQREIWLEKLHKINQKRELTGI